LREATDWQVPIYIKIGASRVFDDVKLAVKAGADVVVVDGMQGGTGASPDLLLEHTGIPTLAAVVEARAALLEMKAAGEVQLVISGGIRRGADAGQARALGGRPTCTTSTPMTCAPSPSSRPSSPESRWWACGSRSTTGASPGSTGRPSPRGPRRRRREWSRVVATTARWPGEVARGSPALAKSRKTTERADVIPPPLSQLRSPPGGGIRVRRGAPDPAGRWGLAVGVGALPLRPAQR